MSPLQQMNFPRSPAPPPPRSPPIHAPQPAAGTATAQVLRALVAEGNTCRRALTIIASHSDRSPKSRSARLQGSGRPRKGSQRAVEGQGKAVKGQWKAKERQSKGSGRPRKGQGKAVKRAVERPRESSGKAVIRAVERPRESSGWSRKAQYVASADCSVVRSKTGHGLSGRKALSLPCGPTSASLGRRWAARIYRRSPATCGTARKPHQRDDAALSTLPTCRHLFSAAAAAPQGRASVLGRAAAGA